MPIPTSIVILTDTINHVINITAKYGKDILLAPPQRSPYPLLFHLHQVHTCVTSYNTACPYITYVTSYNFSLLISLPLSPSISSYMLLCCHFQYHCEGRCMTFVGLVQSSRVPKIF